MAKAVSSVTYTIQVGANGTITEVSVSEHGCDESATPPYNNACRCAVTAVANLADWQTAVKGDWARVKADLGVA